MFQISPIVEKKAIKQQDPRRDRSWHHSRTITTTTTVNNQLPGEWSSGRTNGQSSVTLPVPCWRWETGCWTLRMRRERLQRRPHRELLRWLKHRLDVCVVFVCSWSIKSEREKLFVCLFAHRAWHNFFFRWQLLIIGMCWLTPNNIFYQHQWWITSHHTMTLLRLLCWSTNCILIDLSISIVSIYHIIINVHVWWRQWYHHHNNNDTYRHHEHCPQHLHWSSILCAIGCLIELHVADQKMYVCLSHVHFSII